MQVITNKAREILDMVADALPTGTNNRKAFAAKANVGPHTVFQYQQRNVVGATLTALNKLVTTAMPGYQVALIKENDAPDMHSDVLAQSKDES